MIDFLTFLTKESITSLMVRTKSELCTLIQFYDSFSSCTLFSDRFTVSIAAFVSVSNTESESEIIHMSITFRIISCGWFSVDNAMID